MRLEWPLTERELLIAGRARKTYVQRVIAALVMMIPLAFVWVVARYIDEELAEVTSENLAQGLFHIVRIVQILAAYHIALLATATEIVNEREEGSLELLLLADHTGWDVILSKWITGIITSTTIMISVLPILAIAAMLGGIDVPAVASQTFSYVLIAISVSAIGMYASTVGPSSGHAVIIGYVFTLLWLVVAGAIDIVASGGLQSIGIRYFLSKPIFSIISPTFALPIYTALTCALMLTAAARRTRRVVPEPKATSKANEARITKIRRRIHAVNDPLIVFIHRWAPVKTRRMDFVLTITFIPAVALVPVWGILILALVAAGDASTMLTTIKRDGIWDELLLTQKKHADFARSIFAGIRSRTAFVNYLVLCNILCALFWIEELRTEAGVTALASMFLYYRAAAPLGAYSAIQEGGIVTRETRSMTILLIASAAMPTVPYALYSAWTIVSRVPLSMETVMYLKIAYGALNIVSPILIGYWARRQFLMHCATIPNVGERRSDLMGARV